MSARPLPPVVALVGLLGILVGEQIVPLAKTIWAREPAALSWLHQVKPHMFGHLPKGGAECSGGDTFQRRSDEGGKADDDAPHIP
jgi:xanthosine utilization system XapX-like protein